MKSITENSNFSLEKTDPNAIHIGKIIKKLIKARQITVRDFAGKISCTPRNAYKIFSKHSIDCSLMLRVNKVLEHNLFLYYLSPGDIDELLSKENTDDKKSYMKNSCKTLSLTQQE